MLVEFTLYSGDFLSPDGPPVALAADAVGGVTVVDKQKIPGQSPVRCVHVVLRNQPSESVYILAPKHSFREVIDKLNAR